MDKCYKCTGRSSVDAFNPLVGFVLELDRILILDMERVRCDGFKTRLYNFPPFTVRDGCHLSLDFEGPLDLEEEKVLVSILSGFRKVDGVNVSSKVEYVGPVRRLSWMDRLFNRTVGSAVKSNRGDTTKIRTLLEEFEVDFASPFARIGRTEQILVWLSLAVAANSTILINTAGIDNVGIDKIRALLKHRHKTASVVELNFESSHGRLSLFDKNINGPLKDHVVVRRR